jgi:hypothetical protein
VKHRGRKLEWLEGELQFAFTDRECKAWLYWTEEGFEQRADMTLGTFVKSVGSSHSGEKWQTAEMREALPDSLCPVLPSLLLI